MKALYINDFYSESYAGKGVSELGLSYQRAHRDYANADPKAQKEWVAVVKKTAIAPTR